jgi:hypothetical protein
MTPEAILWFEEHMRGPTGTEVGVMDCFWCGTHSSKHEPGCPWAAAVEAGDRD